MSVERAKSVPPFVLWCTAMIPTAFDDSMSYYEALCALYKFIQDNLVEPINNNATVLDQTVKDMAALKEYVDTYFDNLDVQEEINNKLDAMAEGGQLAEIIAQYANLPCVHAYDTIADMAASETLLAGSFARAMSKTVAGTGDGNYYKVREIQEGDTPDGVNLVSITGTTLVAEIIPDAFMDEIAQDLQEIEAEIDDKYNRTDNLSLQNYLTYDMSNTYYSQGSCVDENGVAYVYTSNTTYNGGNLLVFDKTTETLTNTISTNFKHGGSLVKKGAYIYAAPADETNDILVYNTSTGTVNRNTTLETETSFGNCVGVADYDTNKILVVLGQTGFNANVMGLAPYIFNVNDNQYSRITLTNSKGFNLSMFYAYQDVAYNNGHIYVLMSQPNCILDFYVNGESADLQKIYQIPRRDLLGLTVGEVEGLSFLPDSDVAFLTAHCDENQNLNTRTIKMYFLSFESELPQLYHNNLTTDTESFFDVRFLDNSKTSLYENGSETYPFKSFTRACESATHSKIYTGNQVKIKSGTYNVGRVYGVNVSMSTYDDSQTITLTCPREIKISDSTFYFNKAGASVSINKELVIENNSKATFQGVITFTDLIRAQGGSDVAIENAILTHSGQFTVYAQNASKLKIGVNTSSTATESNMFVVSGLSELITNSNAGIYYNETTGLGVGYTVIKTGVHSADS